MFFHRLLSSLPLDSSKEREPKRNMLGKKMYSFKKLAKKLGKSERRQTQCESLLRESEEMSPSATTPTGFFALYVGDERERFVVPTSFLKHPLFKMLLEKSYNELGLEQRDRLVVPCSVAAFQEVVSAVECCNSNFDFGELVEEFI